MQNLGQFMKDQVRIKQAALLQGNAAIDLSTGKEKSNEWATEGQGDGFSRMPGLGEGLAATMQLPKTVNPQRNY